MKRSTKRLSLNTETLRVLNDAALRKAAGGRRNDTVWDDGCGLNTTTCPSAPLACLTKEGTLCNPLPPILK